MRNHPLGAGEWVGAGYLALVLGALIGGLFGANEWFEIVIAFGVATMVAVVVERIIAAVDWPRRSLPVEERDDG